MTPCKTSLRRSRGPLAGALAWTLLAGLAAGLVRVPATPGRPGPAVRPGAAVDLHPQDGPDVDLRIRIGEEALRVEVGLNLAFVDEVIEPAREELDALHEVEAEGLREPLFEELRGMLTLRVDGIEVTPLLVDYRWQDADPLLVPLFTRCGARALIQIRLQLEYPVKSAPERVAIGWSTYPPDLAIAPRGEAPPIELRALLEAGAEELWIGLSREEPEFLWTGSLEPRERGFEPVPARRPAMDGAGLLRRALALGAGLALFLVAVGTLRRAPRLAWASLAAGLLVSAWAATSGPAPARAPAGEEALAIFRPLHANIYRAFDYEREGDVYDALARSVDGELLDRLYHQIYSGLVLAEEGGAVCKVRGVDLLEAEAAPADGDGGGAFEVTARWTVSGQVHHWGHSHSRTNEYRARYTIEGREDGWRIADSQVLEQRRVESAPLEPVRGRSRTPLEIPEEL